MQSTLRILFELWEEVIRQEINDGTAAYRGALESPRRAEAKARDALAGIAKISAALRVAVKAAKAVDKVVKYYFG